MVGEVVVCDLPRRRGGWLYDPAVDVEKYAENGFGLVFILSLGMQWQYLRDSGLLHSYFERCSSADYGFEGLIPQFTRVELDLAIYNYPSSRAMFSILIHDRPL